jgi:hypothetical protein
LRTGRAAWFNIDMDTNEEDAIRGVWQAIKGTADERTRRLFAGAEALRQGRGGVAALVRVTGMSPNTVRAGIEELKGGVPTAAPGRQRRPGAGRKRTVTQDKTLYADLESLIEPATRGDPEGPLRWTSKSLRSLSAELDDMGHTAGPDMISDLLYDLGYSLQANSKTLEGASHPDRNAQFEHIAAQVTAFQAAGEPVISVDAKKKELVGNFKNNGRELRPAGEPEPVSVHDFVLAAGRATPYGVYDLTHNDGWVSVGADGNTGAFAVQSVRRWWQTMGSVAYPHATKLMITADAGGSNGARLRLWKVELSKLATELQMPISVSHFPPGTSKWNKIEHRMFSHISMNWRGKPLVDHQTIVSLIGATTTTKGLKIRSELDSASYPTGIKIPRRIADALVKRDDFHPEWNYTVHPQ